VNPALEGYAAAVVGATPADGRSALATDLAAVSRLFDDNVQLRSALTDTSIPGPARRAVLVDLLDGQVGEPARRAAGFAAQAVSATEIPTALDWLAHRAYRVAEGEAVTEEPLGHMAARRRVGGFASALFEGLDTAALEEMEDELFRFARTVDATPELRSALTDRELPLELRQGVVHDLLSSKVQPATVALVDYVLAGGRPRDVVGTLEWLVEQTAAARGWRVARVRSAVEVEDDQRQELAATISAMVGAPVDVEVVIEPALIGGAVVQIGDLQVDASARGRLDNLREHLTTSAWQERGAVFEGQDIEAEGAR